MRWLRPIGLVLLLAAILTVAVAWFGATTAQNVGATTAYGIDELRWPVLAPPDWPSRPTAGTVHRSPWRDESVFFAFLTSGSTGVVRMEANRAGWPLRSMTTWRAYHFGALPIPDWKHAASFTLPGGRKVDLPYMPLWRGLAADTLIYAALIAIVVVILRLIRRCIRILRGQCRACGYSFRDLPAGAVCPECGRTTTSRHAPATASVT